MKKIVTRVLAVAIAFTTMVSMSGIMTVNAEAAAKNVTVKYTGKAKQASKVKSISATIDGETVKNKKATVYLSGTKKVKVDTTVTVKVNGKSKINNKKFNNKVAKITYASSNKKVATVNKKGVITAKKAGTTTITIKSSANKKVALKIKLTVKNGVKKMKLKSPKNVTLTVGDTHAFTPEVTTYKKVSKKVEASSSDKKVATVKVSKKGKVTITAKAAGTAEITVAPVKGSDKAQVIKVTVVNKEYKTKVVFTDKKATAVKLTGTIAWEKQSGIADAVAQFAAVLGGNYKVTVNGRTVEIKDGKIADEDLAKIPESGSKTNAEVSATISIADALAMVEKADAKKTANFKGTFTLSGNIKISDVSFASNVLTFNFGGKEMKAFVEKGDLYLDGDQSWLLEMYKVIYDDNKGIVKGFEVVEK